MSKEYNKLAADILAAVGGKGNVMSLRHCLTRLRFILKDEKIAKDNVLKNMDGVATVVKSAGEYMVVIGEHVHSVFEEICAHMGIDGSDRSEVVISKKKKNVVQIVLDVITAAVTPTVNLMSACGILKGILVLLGALGLSNTSAVYQLFNAAGDCFFLFVPIILGYNVARKLSIDPMFGLILATALCYPKIQGVDLDFFGYVVNVSYTGTFLPIIFGVAVAAPIYKFLDKHISKMVKGFMVPLITLFIVFPLTFLVVGPVANMIGIGINKAMTIIISFSPILAGVLLGGLWQVMVLFGIQGVIAMAALMELMSGIPSSLVAITRAPGWAVLGVLLAICLRTKDKNLKSISLPAAFSALFGITEPAIYGVLLSHIKAFVLTCIGAAAGGLVVGLFDMKMYTYAGMGFVGLLGFLNPNGPTNYLGIVLVVAVPLIVGFVLTFLFFKDETPAVEVAPAPAAAPQTTVKATLNRRFNLASPLSGQAKPLSECSDEAFSGEALGKGCVIIPADGQVFSPCDGEVHKLFPTNHALGLVTPDGVEVLIHIGMDTINLKGKYFTPHVKQGDKVTKGQRLITFDKAAIEAAGYKTETPVVITNTDDYLDVVVSAEETVQVGTNLLAVLM